MYSTGTPFIVADALYRSVINDKSNTFALKSAIPTKVSELENDSIYVTDDELEEKLENKVTGVGVNKIEVVTALPEVQEDGVLYIVIG